MLKKILLAAPRGFCAGVVRAYDIVDMALDAVDEPVYVLREIVHNRHVVDELRDKGARFVQRLEDVPEGSLTVFSAHGVPPETHELAAARRLRVIDATCPLVTKVHLQAKKYSAGGYTILLVGHKDHEEVIGTIGEAPDQTIVVESAEEVSGIEVADPAQVLVLTQTTLSVDDTAEIVAAIKDRYPKAEIRNDICFATTNRQAAIKAVTRNAQLILVIGSPNSSNSVRLAETAEAAGCRAVRIENASEIRAEWLEGIETVGVSSGASTPDRLVTEVIDYLKGRGGVEVQEVRVTDETVTFQLPKELISLREAAGAR